MQQTEDGHMCSKKGVFWTCHCQCTHQLTTTVVICTSWMWEEPTKLHPFLKEYWQLVVIGGEGVIFFDAVTTKKLTLFQ